MNKIIITGPESTGKSTLTQQLATHFGGQFIKEYAREYLGSLNRKYTYDDVITIAKEQHQQFKELTNETKGFIFFDTGLIITKTWLLEVFGKCPNWIEKAIIECLPDLYLLCYHDLPWVFDPLRENGSEKKRNFLFKKYLCEIKKTKSDYQIISGFKQERYKLAIKTIENKFFKDVRK